MLDNFAMFMVRIFLFPLIMNSILGHVGPLFWFLGMLVKNFRIWKLKSSSWYLKPAADSLFQLYYSGSGNNCMCCFLSSVLEYVPTLKLLSHIYVHNVSTVMLLVNIRGRTPAKYATFVAFLVAHQLESTLNLRAKVLKMRKEEKSMICLPVKRK